MRDVLGASERIHTATSSDKWRALYQAPVRRARCVTDIETAAPRAVRSTDVIVVGVLPLGFRSTHTRRRAVTRTLHTYRWRICIDLVWNWPTSSYVILPRSCNAWVSWWHKCRWVKLIRARCKFDEYNWQLQIRLPCFIDEPLYATLRLGGRIMHCTLSVRSSVTSKFVT